MLLLISFGHFRDAFPDFSEYFCDASLDSFWTYSWYFSLLLFTFSWCFSRHFHSASLNFLLDIFTVLSLTSFSHLRSASLNIFVMLLLTSFGHFRGISLLLFFTFL